MKGNRFSYLVMMGHFFCDFNQGALVATLPFLVAKGALNYTAVGGLIFAANFISCIIQPTFGYLGDKHSWPWLMSLGIVMSCIGISLIGSLNNYWLMFLAVGLGGIGVAVFHPEGGRNANLVSGANKGGGMSIFAVGGNVGYSVGPIIIAAIVPKLGLNVTVWFIVPSLIMAAVIILNIPALKKFTQQSEIEKAEIIESDKLNHIAPEKDNWPAFTKLGIANVFRAIIHSGLLAFISLYFVAVFVIPTSQGSVRLSIYSIACAVATLFGGFLADKFGFKRIICIFVTGFIPSMAIFLLSGNILFATLMLIPIAFAVNGPYSTMVALGHKFLPNHIGLSSGISLGIAVSLGGMVAPLLGLVADHFGLVYVMYILLAAGAVATVLVYTIPGSKDDGVTPKAALKQ